jgi:transposase-like protein
MNRRQTIPKHLRYTINQFNADFPTDDACLEYLKEQRWPGGVTFCEKCKQERKHYRVTGRTAYACDHCGNHIYPLAGTIFHKSSTSLRLWFHAMYKMGSTRCGISAKQIQRETGVTYKTAWRMFKQIRSLLSEDVQLSGPTEMDETYMGGQRKGSKRGRPGPASPHKTCVVGIVERKGRVIAVTADGASREILHGLAQERILPDSTVFTDELSAYNGLDKINGYVHRRIQHSAGVYVLGDIHTNTIEGFWSLIKRGIGGVYHQVSKKYLQSYLDEYSYRYNRRQSGNLIFTSILKRVSEKASARPSLRAAENPVW